MSGEMDLDQIFAEMDAAANRAERTLDGRFGSIYRELRGLSPEQINDITPDTRDQKEYERLIALVQQATDQNMDQAQLVDRIREMGGVAQKIARRVSSLASLV